MSPIFSVRGTFSWVNQISNYSLLAGAERCMLADNLLSFKSPFDPLYLHDPYVRRPSQGQLAKTHSFFFKGTVMAIPAGS